MKKLVIAIVVLALAAVGALVVSGLLYSGSKYQAEVVIDAPAAEVYRWLTAISPLLAGQVQQKLDADFGKLKRLAEGAADPVKQR